MLFLLVTTVILCVSTTLLYLVRDRALLDRICSGRASTPINIVCSLPVLAYNAYEAYLKPCVSAYLADVFDAAFCGPLRLICPTSCCRHTDRSFPPAPSSLGTWEGKSVTDEEVVWMRARELLGTSTARLKLFEDDVDPRDVGQGAVGDCWLLAAFAAAAEHPGLIQRLFVTKRASASGRYAVRLYDWQRRQWTTVRVDEHLPTTCGGKDGAPRALFAQPHGHEAWVALLEKAFAKFVGSYGALDGGQTAWALNALTGDPVFVLRKQRATPAKATVANGSARSKRAGDETEEEGSSSMQSTPRQRQAPTPQDSSPADGAAAANASPAGGAGGGEADGAFAWARIDMRTKHDAANKRAVEFVGRLPAEEHASARTFLLLRRYARQGALIAASFGNYTPEAPGEGLNGESMGPQGLVAGHAYTLLDARRMHLADGSELRLVQLRNPWGRGEWQGDWGDTSELWKRHTKAKRLCKPRAADDGAFWMAWGDFERIFEQLDVCARARGVRDLQLERNEADGRLQHCLGPLKGCAAGCFAYWCLGRGCAALYGAHGGEEATIDIEGDEQHAFDDKVVARVGGMFEDAAKTVQAL